MTEAWHDVLEIVPTNTPIAKDPSALDPYAIYAVAIGYRLADGSIVPSTQRFRRLRDAKAFHASLPSAPTRPTRISLTATGTIGVVQETYAL